MVPAGGGDGYDAQSIKTKYLAERDRRLVPGRTAMRDLDRDPTFAEYRKDPFTPYVERAPVVDDPDVVIAGGGIAGLLVAVQLRKHGIDRIRIIDQAGGVGGTWYWNRYPGVMCDIESYIYIPMLEEMGVIPTERYASGGEILEHLERIAEKYDLVDDGLFHTDVTRASWDEDAARWQIRTDHGDELSARYYVLACGILNLIKLPDIAGMESFAGRSFHTARWDYDYTGGAPGQPLTKLRDKVVGLVGTGATGIQIVEPLAQAAKHVYVFQRTPSAIGERDNRPTPPDFADSLQPGWQRARMDNFQTVMMGKPVEEDLVDDSWCHYFAVAQHPPRNRDWSLEEYLRNAEEVDFQIMEKHRRRVEELVDDPETAEKLKPYYRYICKRPCFHDEFLQAFNHPNVTLVDCPAGFERMTEAGPVVDGQQFELDCMVYGTGFEPEATPLARRIGQDLVGRGGVTLADKWAEGPLSLFGMLSRGFPNLFVMPAPAQGAVVTVNYTQLAETGAEFVGGAIDLLDRRGVKVFDVAQDAEDAWVQKIVDSFVDASNVMSACTPSRINNEGHPEAMNPRTANYGRGFGNYFAYRDLLEQWVASDDCEGLELDTRPVEP